MVTGLAMVNAKAAIPDQLLDYVGAVSGLQSQSCGQCVIHHADGFAVLIGYPMDAPQDERLLCEAVVEALKLPCLKRLTVLAANVPQLAPENAKSSRDFYWAIPVMDSKPSQKVRNMIRRAAREVDIVRQSGPNAWTAEHSSLVESFCLRKGAAIDDGSKHIFGQLGAYLTKASEAVLFSARNRRGELQACAIGDFTAMATAFYMFAFRAAAAPPGTADLLLSAIIAEAGQRGHERINLGLGINGGVEFFKKKWGAAPWLPYVETSWDIRPKSWFARLLGK